MNITFENKKTGKEITYHGVKSFEPLYKTPYYIGYAMRLANGTFLVLPCKAFRLKYSEA